MGKMSGCTYYDDPEFDYQDYWIGREYEDQAERQVLNQCYQMIGPQEWMVDIGGGFGRLVNQYRPWVNNAVIIEPSEKIIQGAKLMTKNWKKLQLVQGTAECLCLQPNSVDVVQMIRVAHHCQDLALVIKNIYQVLRSPGWLILEYPNKINGLMTLRNWMQGNWGFRQDLSSIDRRAKGNQSDQIIPFMNHHPIQVEKWLQMAGFEIGRSFSVSNLRRWKFIPLKLALRFDQLTWDWARRIWWGPSIFILAKKD